MTNLVKLLILLELIILPVIPTTAGFGYEYIKVIFFIFINCLIGFLWVVLLTRRELTISWTKVKLLSLLFIVALLISSLAGVEPSFSLTGRAPYYQGWVVYVYCFLLALIISSLKFNLSELSVGFLTPSLFVAILAIRQWVQLNILHLAIPAYAGRVISTFGQPNFYAGFLILSLPLIWLNRDKNFRVWRWLGAVLSATAVILSQSRLAIGLLLLLVFALLLFKLKRKVKTPFLIILTLFMLIPALLIGQSRLYTKEGNVTTRFGTIDYSPQKRLLIWPVILDLAARRPLFGYGLENIGTVFGTNLHPETPGKFPTNALVDLKNLYVDRSHNYLLDLLMFSGAAGLLAWLFIVGFLLLKAKGVLKAGLAVYLIFSLFQNQSVVHLIYFWLILGLVDKTIDKGEFKSSN